MHERTDLVELIEGFPEKWTNRTEGKLVGICNQSRGFRGYSQERAMQVLSLKEDPARIARSGHVLLQVALPPVPFPLDTTVHVDIF